MSEDFRFEFSEEDIPELGEQTAEDIELATRTLAAVFAKTRRGSLEVEPQDIAHAEAYLEAMKEGDPQAWEESVAYTSRIVRSRRTMPDSLLAAYDAVVAPHFERCMRSIKQAAGTVYVSAETPDPAQHLLRGLPAAQQLLSTSIRESEEFRQLLSQEGGEHEEAISFLVTAQIEQAMTNIRYQLQQSMHS